VSGDAASLYERYRRLQELIADHRRQLDAKQRWIERRECEAEVARVAWANSVLPEGK
jgi:hypothetical protein